MGFLYRYFFFLGGLKRIFRCKIIDKPCMPRKKLLNLGLISHLLSDYIFVDEATQTQRMKGLP
jgi:hypothetical protein